MLFVIPAAACRMVMERIHELSHECAIRSRAINTAAGAMLPLAFVVYVAIALIAPLR